MSVMPHEKENKKKVCKLKKIRKSKKQGSGIINSIIDHIPFELHVPGYQYCGPGTDLAKRLSRGDTGINPLDAACKQHDIQYSKSKDSKARSEADEILQEEAMKRVFSPDASLMEKSTALGVAVAMNAKKKLSGNGLKAKKEGKSVKKKDQISFSKLIKNAKVAIKTKKPENINAAIKVAVASIKEAKEGKRIRQPRSIKLPSVSGGVLPLIPIFAGLGAIGSIAGSAAGIANAINQAKRGQLELEESKRHNRSIEAIAMGNKTGKGLYLKFNPKGNGFYLSPYEKNH